MLARAWRPHPLVRCFGRAIPNRITPKQTVAVDGCTALPHSSKLNRPVLQNGGARAAFGHQRGERDAYKRASCDVACPDALQRGGHGRPGGAAAVGRVADAKPLPGRPAGWASRHDVHPGGVRQQPDLCPTPRTGQQPAHCGARVPARRGGVLRPEPVDRIWRDGRPPRRRRAWRGVRVVVHPRRDRAQPEPSPPVRHGRLRHRGVRDRLLRGAAGADCGLWRERPVPGAGRLAVRRGRGGGGRLSPHRPPGGGRGRRSGHPVQRAGVRLPRRGLHRHHAGHDLRLHRARRHRQGVHARGDRADAGRRRPPQPHRPGDRHPAGPPGVAFDGGDPGAARPCRPRCAGAAVAGRPALRGVRPTCSSG